MIPSLSPPAPPLPLLLPLSSLPRLSIHPSSPRIYSPRFYLCLMASLQMKSWSTAHEVQHKNRRRRERRRRRKKRAGDAQGAQETRRGRTRRAGDAEDADARGTHETHGTQETQETRTWDICMDEWVATKMVWERGEEKRERVRRGRRRVRRQENEKIERVARKNRENSEKKREERGRSFLFFSSLSSHSTYSALYPSLLPRPSRTIIEGAWNKKWDRGRYTHPSLPPSPLPLLFLPLSSYYSPLLILSLLPLPSSPFTWFVLFRWETLERRRERASQHHQIKSTYQRTWDGWKWMEVDGSG